MNEDKDKHAPLRCDNCECDITFGRDVISVEKCVSGPRGVIPLGEVLRFCSDSCVSQFFDHDPVSHLKEIPRRIP